MLLLQPHLLEGLGDSLREATCPFLRTNNASNRVLGDRTDGRTFTRMKNATLSLVAAVALLGGGYSLAHAQRSSTPTTPEAQRSYLCFSGHSAAEVMEKSNHLGREGWKLAGASPSGHSSIWCFERFGVHPAAREK